MKYSWLSPTGRQPCRALGVRLAVVRCCTMKYGPESALSDSGTSPWIITARLSPLGSRCELISRHSPKQRYLSFRVSRQDQIWMTLEMFSLVATCRRDIRWRPVTMVTVVDSTSHSQRHFRLPYSNPILPPTTAQISHVTSISCLTTQTQAPNFATAYGTTPQPRALQRVATHTRHR